MGLAVGTHAQPLYPHPGAPILKFSYSPCFLHPTISATPQVNNYPSTFIFQGLSALQKFISSQNLTTATPKTCPFPNDQRNLCGDIYLFTIDLNFLMKGCPSVHFLPQYLLGSSKNLLRQQDSSLTPQLWMYLSPSQIFFRVAYLHLSFYPGMHSAIYWADRTIFCFNSTDTLLLKTWASCLAHEYDQQIKSEDDSKLAQIAMLG